MKKDNKSRRQASWWELPAWMLPCLLFTSLIFFTAWSAWWI